MPGTVFIVLVWMEMISQEIPCRRFSLHTTKIPVQDSMIHALGMCPRLSESVKIHSPTARVFSRFPKVSQHPVCMDHAILHGEPFGIPLIQAVRVQTAQRAKRRLFNVESTLKMITQTLDRR